MPITSGTPGTAQVVSGTYWLFDVACPSATTCEAVGGNASGLGVVVPINNGTPGTPQVVPGVLPGTGLYGVACSSATTCEAVGFNAADQGVVVPITNGTPGTVQVVPGAAFLDGVVCPSPTTCEASSQGLLMPITNGIPGIPQVVSGIEALACASATTCEAVGENTLGEEVVMPIKNGTPGTAQVVSVNENLVTENLRAVACPSPTTCVAVGSTALGQGVVAVVLLAGSTHVPLSVGLCQHGGWQSLTNVQGQPFGNQGQCITYLMHNPVSVADLAGSFTGTTPVPFPQHGCGPTEALPQSFDAIYPGRSAVGAVDLGISNCTPANPSGYAFSIATIFGTLNGVVTGPFMSPDFELTLTVVSGTGAFAAMTGTINVSIQETGVLIDDGRFEVVTGSVTVP